MRIKTFLMSEIQKNCLYFNALYFIMLYDAYLTAMIT